MPKIIVNAEATHSMIPPNHTVVEKIKKLTGLDAHPKASGLQAMPPFIVELEGTEETINILKTNGLNAHFA